MSKQTPKGMFPKRIMSCAETHVTVDTRTVSIPQMFNRSTFPLQIENIDQANVSITVSSVGSGGGGRRSKDCHRFICSFRKKIGQIVS